MRIQFPIDGVSEMKQRKRHVHPDRDGRGMNMNRVLADLQRDEKAKEKAESAAAKKLERADKKSALIPPDKRPLVA